MLQYILFYVILYQNLTEDVSHTMDVYTQTITNHHKATYDIDLDYFRG